QRSRRAQGQGLAISADCFATVAQAVPPDLQRAQLRDSVLDVVEGIFEEVRLEIPARDPLAIEPAPVDYVSLESAAALQPLLVACVGVAALGVRVDPLLECVDRSAVREEVHRPLEQV